MRDSLDGPAVATTVAPRATASWTTSPPCYAAGAVHEHPLAGGSRCGFRQCLVGGERGHRERSGSLPRNGGRPPRDECGRSHQPLRPRALVSQRHRVGEHLVAACETRYLLADRGDDTCRFDAKCQPWLSADVPVAYADDLVPVADPCGAHQDHELVRRGRSRRRELEHAHVATERINADGSHPTHTRHAPEILEFHEPRSSSSPRARVYIRTDRAASGSRDRAPLYVRRSETTSPLSRRRLVARYRQLHEFSSYSPKASPPRRRRARPRQVRRGSHQSRSAYAGEVRGD